MGKPGRFGWAFLFVIILNEANTVMRNKWIIVLLFCVSSAYGQGRISESEKIAFVYYKNKPHNFIVVPNIGKFASFKIYQKLPINTSFVQIAEKKKPPLPMRNNITPYAVTWQDEGKSTKEVEYKVYAFDKNGSQICEMNIVWEDDIESK